MLYSALISTFLEAIIIILGEKDNLLSQQHIVNKFSKGPVYENK